MPDQDTKPTTIETDQTQRPAGLQQSLMWVVPIAITVVVVVIIALAVIGPSVGTVYSSIGTTL